MTLVGLITDNDESAYGEEIQNLEDWCLRNNLSLNTGKAKELIVGFKRSENWNYALVFISGERVERVPSICFLRVHITEDFTWTNNITAHVKNV